MHCTEDKPDTVDKSEPGCLRKVMELLADKLVAMYKTANCLVELDNWSPGQVEDN
jgi:hypothetical protein